MSTQVAQRTGLSLRRRLVLKWECLSRRSTRLALRALAVLGNPWKYLWVRAQNGRIRVGAARLASRLLARAGAAIRRGRIVRAPPRGAAATPRTHGKLLRPP